MVPQQRYGLVEMCTARHGERRNSKGVVKN